jgi:hypothetical protein
MTNNPKPLCPVPSQYATADLVEGIRFDLLPEQTADGGNRNVHNPIATAFADGEGLLGKLGHETSAGYVEVAEVGAIGLVKVEVDFVERGIGADCVGREELVTGRRFGADVEVVDDWGDESELK